MHDDDICRKTAAGQLQIQQRSARLTPRLRTTLILVDGRASVGRLRTMAASAAGAEDPFEALAALGLIEKLPDAPAAAPAAAAPAAAAESDTEPAVPPDDAQRFVAAHKLMTETAVDTLGLRAFLFTLKVEKCFAPADLLALLPELRAAVARRSGEDAGRRLEQRLRRLLG